MFGNYINVFHKTEIQTVILSCFVCKNFYWIKSYDIILITIFFLYAWKCIISGLVCRSEFWCLRKKPTLVFSKWLFFQNSLGLSWNTLSGKMQVKKWNYFVNFSLMNFWIYFCDIWIETDYMISGLELAVMDCFKILFFI